MEFINNATLPNKGAESVVMLKGVVSEISGSNRGHIWHLMWYNLECLLKLYGTDGEGNMMVWSLPKFTVYLIFAYQIDYGWSSMSLELSYNCSLIIYFELTSHQRSKTEIENAMEMVVVLIGNYDPHSGKGGIPK